MARGIVLRWRTTNVLIVYLPAGLPFLPASQWHRPAPEAAAAAAMKGEKVLSVHLRSSACLLAGGPHRVESIASRHVARFLVIASEASLGTAAPLMHI